MELYLHHLVNNVIFDQVMELVMHVIVHARFQRMLSVGNFVINQMGEHELLLYSSFLIDHEV